MTPRMPPVASSISSSMRLVLERPAAGRELRRAGRAEARVRLARAPRQSRKPADRRRPQTPSSVNWAARSGPSGRRSSAGVGQDHRDPPRNAQRVEHQVAGPWRRDAAGASRDESPRASCSAQSGSSASRPAAASSWRPVSISVSTLGGVTARARQVRLPAGRRRDRPAARWPARGPGQLERRRTGRAGDGGAPAARSARDRAGPRPGRGTATRTSRVRVGRSRKDGRSGGNSR